ncbi:MAG: peptide deformylase [Hyphomicrobiaceae bacterium]
MPLLPIVKLPDPILREVSTPIEAIDAGVRNLARDMLATMYDAPGVGLAAIQVGVPRRLLVVDVGERDDTEADGEARDEKRKPSPITMINPTIVRESDGRRVYEEGCLSLPDVQVEIERPNEITVAFVDLEGRSVELTADGLLATAIQHEIDHLNGRLIIDYLSRLRRDIVVRKFKKLARGG